MNHTDCFKHFGTSPANIYWSWSGRGEKAVAITLWTDFFGVSPAGKSGYYRQQFNARELKLPGFKELAENIKFAKKKLRGEFHVIMADAKDKRATQRKIAVCTPSKLVMRVVKFDETTGEFEAEVI